MVGQARPAGRRRARCGRLPRRLQRRRDRPNSGGLRDREARPGRSTAGTGQSHRRARDHQPRDRAREARPAGPQQRRTSGLARRGRSEAVASSPTADCDQTAHRRPTGTPDRRPERPPPELPADRHPDRRPERLRPLRPEPGQPPCPASPSQYTQEFNGDSLPSNWGAYLGVPGGESSSECRSGSRACAPSAAARRTSWPRASTRAACTTRASSQEYGAWFARLQATAEPSGQLFTDIFLLWPDNNQWPPEIDVYEDEGDRSSTVATLWNTVGNACGSSPSSPSACTSTQQANGGQRRRRQHRHRVAHLRRGVDPLGRVLAHRRHASSSPPRPAQVKSPAQQPALTMDMALQSQNLSRAARQRPRLRDTMNVDWVEQFGYNG